ncbi:hypothetical protein NOM01_09765 [Sporolactobacillus sp. STSJ-5]|uniref:hypothetical protein n=1 Tax=Sporolactobacillus sp. STSJ-5 TaxID=2965076 RepID=UPI002104B405|nr:hypothetical protein [Sporolactobacillus sp. STSJ-5]MCQ2010300.1 hypothetical protein [Sporolactobacillus sp. STSJ-5]
MKIVRWVILCVLLLFAGGTLLSKHEPPTAIVTVNHARIETVEKNYNWYYGLFYLNRVSGHSDIIFNMLHTKVIKPGTKAKINFADHSNPKLMAYIWRDRKTGPELAVHKSQITLPKKPGTYVILLQSQWTRGSSDYVFSVKVQ